MYIERRRRFHRWVIKLYMKAATSLFLILTAFWMILIVYGKCSKILNTLKLRTPKIIAENNFQNILKNRTLTFFGKVNF